MLTKVLLVVVVAVAVAVADRPSYSPPPPPPPPSYNPPAPSYRQPEPVGPAQYDFNWAVKDDHSGNDFGHQESRNGYDTNGAYYVLLPDGRLQRVTYSVNGDSGFLAEVSYEGEAQYPQQQSYRPAAPSYQQPPPSYA